jgi:transketolase
MNDYNMRADFGKLLHEEMKKNDKIFIISPDLGYVLFDKIREDFPDRFCNCGASEQLAISIAVAYALEEYIPIVYSISSFLLLRPAEFIRNYLGYEGINIKLVGSGLEDDYKNQGFTHHFFGIVEYCDWMDIDCYCPDEKTLIEDFNRFINDPNPSFLGLRK